MEENTILKPSYLDNFNCLENKCPDPCYIYKEVFLTKSEYEEYRKIKIENIDFADIVGKLGNKRTEDRYAKIRIRKGIDISIKEYLHLINLELGYEYLPSIYKFSPIYLNKINGAFEENGNLACPKIAKLALLRKEGIGLIHGEITDIEGSIIYRDIVSVGSENLIMKYFWDIRINSLNILMNREYSIEERLILLGIFYEHLDLLNNHKNIDLLPDKMKELLEFFSTKNYKVFFKRLPENEYLNLELLEYILSINIESFKNKVYIEDMKNNYNGFQPRMDVIDLRTIYLENRSIYSNYIQDKEYILENYVVNEFLKNAIPYVNYGALKELYDSLITDFIVFKLILISNSVYSGRMNKDLLIEKVVNYSRFKIENPSFLEMTKTFLKMNQHNSIENLSLILNN